MPLTKSKKQDVVKTLTAQAKKSSIVIFSNFHGLPVSKLTALRRALRNEGAEYTVAKKTLVRVAFGDAGMPVPESLDGEVGVAFGSTDPMAAARVVYTFAKGEKDHFSILSGVFEGKTILKQDVVAIATIPSREVLLGQLVGVLQAPIAGFARVLAGVPRSFVYAVDQIKDKRS